MDRIQTIKHVYAFHKASIHERRLVAQVCAALPLVFLLLFLSTIAYGVLRKPLVLLSVSAIMNTSAWLWICSTAVYSIAGIFLARKALQNAPQQRTRLPISRDAEQAASDVDGFMDVDRVAHLIVLPNFKEEESMLAETLHSLGESNEAESFFVVLAMEEREPGSQGKAERLKELFRETFAHIAVTVHPANLFETHLDGSEDRETPGKASNLKWAVRTGVEEFQSRGFLKSLSSVILTVSDADCLFHPDYYSSVTRDFNMLRENPGSDHLWTMWQAPQLPHRNFYSSAACSRIWGYISSVYETGGVCSLAVGGTHMTFSGYSLSLQLAMDASAWDGDVIAEDHHAFLKCFFYSARASAEESLVLGRGYGTCGPRLTVRPIHLPVKSTSVAAESYWRTWVERWYQAKRHAQGVSELSYAVLAAYDALRTLPLKLHCFSLYWQFSKVIVHLWCMHLLPMCHAMSLGSMTAYWLYHGGHVPMCAAKPPAMASLTHLTWPEARKDLVCGLAGSWVLVWPIVIPTVLVIIANYLSLHVVFMRDKRSNRQETIWHQEDGGVASGYGCCSQYLATFTLITWDCVVLLSAVMIPYGFLAEVAAYIDVAMYGNRVKYHTAAKPSSNATLSYGTMSRMLIDEPERAPSPSSSSSREDTGVGEASSSSGARSPSLGPSDDEPTLPI